jgi:hypothetical protein
MEALSIIYGSKLSHVRSSSREAWLMAMWSSQVSEGFRWFAWKLRVALRLARETVSAKVSFSEKAVKIAL